MNPALEAPPAASGARGPDRAPGEAAAVAPASMPLPAAPLQPVDAAVFPLAVRKVVIDAGHGGGSTGTRTPEGMLEKDLTLDIAERLRRLLAQQSFQVVMTRESDRDVSLKERGALANRAGGRHLRLDPPQLDREPALAGGRDLLHGHHRRPLPRPGSPPPRTASPATPWPTCGACSTASTPACGRRSRISWPRRCRAPSSSRSGKVSPEIQNRGVKTAPFIVLLTTDMPAILAEVSSMSNEEEARLLTKPLYRQYIAEALAKGIRAYAESVEETPEVAPAARKESR